MGSPPGGLATFWIYLVYALLGCKPSNVYHILYFLAFLCCSVIQMTVLWNGLCMFNLLHLELLSIISWHWDDTIYNDGNILMKSAPLMHAQFPVHTSVPMGPTTFSAIMHKKKTYEEKNLIVIKLWSYQITTNFCTWYDSIAVMSCAKFSGDPCDRIPYLCVCSDAAYPAPLCVQDRLSYDEWFGSPRTASLNGDNCRVRQKYCIAKQFGLAGATVELLGCSHIKITILENTHLSALKMTVIQWKSSYSWKPWPFCWASSDVHEDMTLWQHCKTLCQFLLLNPSICMKIDFKMQSIDNAWR